MTENEQRKQKAIELLRSDLSPGDTIYTKLEHQSASGMSRVIQVIIFKNNKPLFLSDIVLAAFGQKRYRTYEGVLVKGMGTNMGFALVSKLSELLFHDPLALKQSWL